MVKTKIKKSWYRRWWAIVIFVFIGLAFISYLLDENPKTQNIKNSLFELTGNEIIAGVDLCGEKNSFSTDVTLKRFGVELPESCRGITSFDVTNYCSRGSQKGENIENYYCRLTRYISCNIISDSGEIVDVKKYGIKKELELIEEVPLSETCTNATFRLKSIIIE